MKEILTAKIPFKIDLIIEAYKSNQSFCILLVTAFEVESYQNKEFSHQVP